MVLPLIRPPVGSRPSDARIWALGAALLGGLGAGVYRDVDDAVAAMRYGQRQVEPDEREVATYETIFQEVYRRFYPAVAPLSQTISDLQATTAILE